jgi:hypothetical protein
MPRVPFCNRCDGLAALPYGPVHQSSILPSVFADRGWVYGRIRLPLDGYRTTLHRNINYASHTTIKAHPAKAGVAKPRVLASSATSASKPGPDATKDPKTAEPPDR